MPSPGLNRLEGADFRSNCFLMAVSEANRGAARYASHYTGRLEDSSSMERFRGSLSCGLRKKALQSGEF